MASISRGWDDKADRPVECKDLKHLTRERIREALRRGARDRDAVRKRGASYGVIRPSLRFL
jgi:hypothetical protein